MFVPRGSEMRTIVLFALLVAAAPLPAQDHLTVDQLEQRLAAEHNRSDRDIAQHLENLQLTQRISGDRLEKLEAALPGPDSRTQLLGIADLSQVLDLPPAEIPSDPPPTAAEQQEIVARAIRASRNTPGQLPDFDATATITRFRNLKYLSASNTELISVVKPVPLFLNRGTDAVTYRQGRAFNTQISRAWAPDGSLKAGVDSCEGLYQVMGNLLGDMRNADPEWTHWEQGPAGNLAVFRFSVNEDHAHFPIRTVIDPLSNRGYAGNPGYHAEVALDPATGAVYRFLLRATLDRGQQVSRADVVVEFSPVTVDGKSFLAPHRTITTGVSQSLVGIFNVDYYHNQFSRDFGPLMHVTDAEYSGYQPGQWKPPGVRDPAFVATVMQMTGERVTVQQLEEVLAGLRRSDDRAIAHRLGRLELTERLAPERYASLRNGLPGKASQEALLGLYDLSAFDDLPQTDLAPGNPPDANTQGQIIRKAVEFVAQVTHKMPDLFATRDLVRFEDLEVVRGAVQPFTPEIRPLARVDQSSGTVHFRDGREVVEASKRRHPTGTPMGLDTWGTFGPILEIVMTDVLNSKLGWSHWEHGSSRLLAVFHYAVPQEASHYNVRFCCYLSDDGLPNSFSPTPGYHGELVIDPVTGAILRLVLNADLGSNRAQPDAAERTPLLRNGVLVEYGAITIGSMQYVCPTRFVSVMTTWTLGAQGAIRRSMSRAEGARAAKKALKLMEFSRVNSINEAAFSNYHVFRSEMRIVSDPADPASTPKN